MMHARSLCSVLLAIELASLPAQAGQVQSARSAVTQADVLDCMGQGTADAAQQVDICTKILRSGKIKAGHEGTYLSYRGAAYLAQGDTAAALADLNKAIASKDTAESRFTRAMIHMAGGAFELAQGDLDSVSRTQPDFAPAFFMRGVIAYRKADFDLAVTEFDGAVTRLPSYYQAIYARGLARLKTGNASAGETDLAAARGMSAQVESDLARMGVK